MSDTASCQTFRGRCLCGAVQLHVQSDRPYVSACHCGICRRWGGGPMLTLEGHRAPRIDGEAQLRVYASSAWAERGFCGTCGSHVFYRLKEGEFYAFPVGLFDEGGEWPFTLQVFIDEKPANYAFAGETTTMTGAEVYAQFASP